MIAQDAIRPAKTKPSGAGAAPVMPGDIAQARGQFDDVEKAAGRGDWSKFGGAMDKFKGMLAKPPPVALHD